MSDIRQIEILPGQVTVVYKHMNAKGKLIVKVSSEFGDGILDFWWVKGPFGSVEGLGRLSGTNILEIKGLGWGKLKARARDTRVILQIVETMTSSAVSFPPIKF
jgi:hypothetical protein